MKSFVGLPLDRRMKSIRACVHTCFGHLPEIPPTDEAMNEIQWKC